MHGEGVLRPGRARGAPSPACQATLHLPPVLAEGSAGSPAPDWVQDVPLQSTRQALSSSRPQSIWGEPINSSLQHPVRGVYRGGRPQAVWRGEEPSPGRDGRLLSMGIPEGLALKHIIPFHRVSLSPRHGPLATGGESQILCLLV